MGQYVSLNMKFQLPGNTDRENLWRRQPYSPKSSRIMHHIVQMNCPDLKICVIILLAYVIIPIAFHLQDQDIHLKRR